MNYGERLKTLRKQLKISQIELSERSGVSQQTISRIERGERAPSGATFAIAETLGVNADWLRSGDGDQHKENSVDLEPIGIFEWEQIPEILAHKSPTPTSHLTNSATFGRPVFALLSPGIFNLTNPLGYVFKEYLIVNHSKSAIEDTIRNLSSKQPFERLAIVSIPKLGIVTRILTPDGTAIWLEDPKKRLESVLFDSEVHSILGVIVEVTTPLK